MSLIDDFLFIDIEYNPGTKAIREYGFALGSRGERVSKPDLLIAALQSAKFVAGHNILQHDLPILESHFGVRAEPQNVVDTLLLSSLLFPNKPYHHLRKEYLHDESDPSNPLKDALLSKTLLLDCVEKWKSYPWELQTILFLFLRKEPGFAPFFGLVDFRGEDVRAHRGELESWMLRKYRDSICLNQNFLNEWANFKAEWCFLLTLFFDVGSTDFVPYWVRYQYPHIENILHKRRLVPCGDSACPYCSEQLNLNKQLKKWFGYDNFRKFSEEEKVPLQEQVANAALLGKSFLAVFPTGGGKSLTFQLPALIAGSQTGSLTVVITPIQALMKDQVDVLNKRHQIDRAAYINGMLSPLERAKTIEDVHNGERDLLYISPESLRSNTIFKLLCHRRIERIVIDEAHCFSSWGHDFRVDYLYLSEFLLDLQRAKNLESPVPVSCFTATAKPSVIEDIVRYFKDRLNVSLEQFVSSAKRTNLHYSLIPVPESEKERKKQLIALLKRYSEPKIVYASKVKTTLTLAEGLKEYGFASAGYNGKMDTDEKMRVLEKFQNGDVDTIVATTAFGMGVDKDNVKLVAHYQISSTLENYVQEAGRAGRNPEIQADCVILYNKKDLDSNFFLLQFSKLSQNEISDVWKALKKLFQNKKNVCISALELADKCGWTERETDSSITATKVRLAILVLEEQGFLKRKRNTTLVFGTSIAAETVEQARVALGNDLVDVPGSNENIAFRIMRHIISKRWTHDPDCALDELLQSLGLNREEASDGLRLLRSKNLLDSKDDLSVKVRRSGSFSSRGILSRTKELEAVLLDACKSADVNCRLTLNLTKLNATMESGGAASRKNLFVFRGILRYLAHESVAEIHLIEAGRQIYQIEFLVSPGDIDKNLKDSWECFEIVIETLLELSKEKSSDSKEKADVMVWFSINELITKIYGVNAVNDVTLQKRVEFSLLFLHSIGSIVLDKGLMVFYNAMNIEVDGDALSRMFRTEDFALLRTHYEHKAEAIHIVGEYARLMQENPAQAQILLDDYFTKDTESFRMLHLPNANFNEALSDELRARIDDVNEEQEMVIRSRAKHILVGAGPGSGKTHLLVHKAASLLWMEEAKPDSILVLTFTRSACREIKKRLLNLAGPLAKSVTVSTFHALAFSILGIQGSKKDLKQNNGSDDAVILQAVDLIKSGEDLGIGVPGVILVDEFQDLSQAEYDLLKVLYNLGDKDPRVIIVGDDDQSIFGFRGGSSEYFKKFEEDFPKTQKFYLTKNYRSCSGIVNVNNILLRQLKDRVKQDSAPVAMTQSKASLLFYEERDNMKCAFAAADYAAEQIPLWNAESVCILTHDNAEAFLAASKLEAKNIAYKFIKGCDKDRFKITDLREIRYFKGAISKSECVGKRPWSFEELNDMLRETKTQHSNLQNAENWALLDSLVAHFISEEQASGMCEATLGDLLTFFDEVTLDEVEKKNQRPVSVGTMHSSKGMEFDHVILSLDSWNPNVSDDQKRQENYRLLYVACTRARNSITIFGCKENFPADWTNSFIQRPASQKLSAPETIHVEISLKDINLGWYLYKEEKKTLVEKLQAEILSHNLKSTFNVTFFEKTQSYCVKNENFTWAWFSQDFSNGILKSLEKNGFRPVQAELAQVTYWRSAETDEGAWVPVFTLKFASSLEHRTVL